jgi:hypothetical protein
MRRAQNRGPRRTRIILCATFAVGLSCAHAWNPATIVGPNDLKTQPFPLAVQVYQNGDFHNFTVIFGMHKDTGNLPLDVHLRLWVARQGGDGLEELAWIPTACHQTNTAGVTRGRAAACGRRARAVALRSR